MHDRRAAPTEWHGEELLARACLISLRGAVSAGEPLWDALNSHTGGLEAAEGVWRFFSPSHPAVGVTRWNEEWRSAWHVSAGSALSFGEDVFGNQLLITPARPTMQVCDHETGACHDLGLGVIDVLEAVVEHGLAWIDFYSSEVLSIGREFVPRPTWEQHLHWVHPLFLGGASTADNVRNVDRFDHLHGHAKLWKEVRELPPGTELRPR